MDPNKPAFTSIFSFISLYILSLILIITGCSKKSDTAYYPFSDNCWQIEYWTGLEPDSLLTIDTILDIPQADLEYVNWLSRKENHIRIRSLDSENFEDLKCLDQYIAGKRIVQLGESNHGTKEYNLIKVRLIKYLHEVHGFNVIAFESGLFDCYYANKNSEDVSITDFMEQSIFKVWHTKEVLDLFYYMVYGTDNLLQLAGFDCQDLLKNNNQYKRAVLLKEYAKVIDPYRAAEIYLNDIEVTKNISIENQLLENRDLYIAKVDSALHFFSTHYNAILDSVGGDGALFDVSLQSLRSTRAFIDQQYYYYLEDYTRSYVLRDSTMAANIRFLTNVIYPDEKIIIWAHNAHIAYNQDHQTYHLPDGAKIMGNWLFDFFQQDIYTIGLYSLYGEFSWAGENWPLVLPDEKNSLEAICYGLNKKYVFFDVENHPPREGNEWFDEVITGRLHDEIFDNIILRMEYDGIIFIDKNTTPVYIY